MAEAIGLIASVIQVAGAGLKLSQTLYTYAGAVSSADRRIKDIAKEVELTSFVIKELGDIFENDETSGLLSNNAVKTADETVKECSAVFAELDAAIKKTKKNTIGRLMQPFKEPKLDLLRNHIDKLKSTLHLLMQVLTHAQLKANQKLDREAEALQREEIKALLQNKKASTKRYEESLKNYYPSDDEADKELGRGLDGPSSGSSQVTVASVASSLLTATHLQTCVQHIQGLLQDIESLQKVLSDDEKSVDPSEHQQSLIGSYFRARGHLDSVLLGNPPGALARGSVGSSETAFSIQKTLTASSLQDTKSGIEQESVSRSILKETLDIETNWSSETELRSALKRAIEKAQETARAEERDKLTKKVEQTGLQNWKMETHSFSPSPAIPPNNNGGIPAGDFGQQSSAADMEVKPPSFHRGAFPGELIISDYNAPLPSARFQSHAHPNIHSDSWEDSSSEEDNDTLPIEKHNVSLRSHSSQPQEAQIPHAAPRSARTSSRSRPRLHEHQSQRGTLLPPPKIPRRKLKPTRNINSMNEFSTLLQTWGLDKLATAWEILTEYKKEHGLARVDDCSCSVRYSSDPEKNVSLREEIIFRPSSIPTRLFTKLEREGRSPTFVIKHQPADAERTLERGAVQSIPGPSSHVTEVNTPSEGSKETRMPKVADLAFVPTKDRSFVHISRQLKAARAIRDFPHIREQNGVEKELEFVREVLREGQLGYDAFDEWEDEEFHLQSQLTKLRKQKSPQASPKGSGTEESSSEDWDYIEEGDKEPLKSRRTEHPTAPSVSYDCRPPPMPPYGYAPPSMPSMRSGHLPFYAAKYPHNIFPHEQTQSPARRYSHHPVTDSSFGYNQDQHTHSSRRNSMYNVTRMDNESSPHVRQGGMKQFRQRITTRSARSPAGVPDRRPSNDVTADEDGLTSDYFRRLRMTRVEEDRQMNQNYRRVRQRPSRAAIYSQPMKDDVTLSGNQDRRDHQQIRSSTQVQPPNLRDRSSSCETSPSLIGFGDEARQGRKAAQDLTSPTEEDSEQSIAIRPQMTPRNSHHKDEPQGHNRSAYTVKGELLENPPESTDQPHGPKSISGIYKAQDDKLLLDTDSRSSLKSVRASSPPAYMFTQQQSKVARDAMGNIIVTSKKPKKLTSGEARKKKRERMVRRRRGEDTFSSEGESTALIRRPSHEPASKLQSLEAMGVSPGTSLHEHESRKQPAPPRQAHEYQPPGAPFASNSQSDDAQLLSQLHTRRSQSYSVGLAEDIEQGKAYEMEDKMVANSTLDQFAAEMGSLYLGTEGEEELGRQGVDSQSVQLNFLRDDLYFGIDISESESTSPEARQNQDSNFQNDASTKHPGKRPGHSGDTKLRLQALPAEEVSEGHGKADFEPEEWGPSDGLRRDRRSSKRVRNHAPTDVTIRIHDGTTNHEFKIPEGTPDVYHKRSAQMLVSRNAHGSETYFAPLTSPALVDAKRRPISQGKEGASPSTPPEALAGEARLRVDASPGLAMEPRESMAIATKTDANEQSAGESTARGRPRRVGQFQDQSARTDVNTIGKDQAASQNPHGSDADSDDEYSRRFKEEERKFLQERRPGRAARRESTMAQIKRKMNVLRLEAARPHSLAEEKDEEDEVDQLLRDWTTVLD